MRKTLSLLLTLAMVVTMVFGSAGSVFAADSTAATTMKIAGTDGTVTITNEKGKDVPANVDTKLLNGYTIKTAAASYCFISLDDSKAIKLGQNTKVKVEKSGKKIELNVKNGEIFFDVDKKLSGNESMNIKTGNMTTGIRGTSGILKTIKQGQSSIDLFQLFSGKTEMKANTQKNVQNIIERILGALGITAQTQTVTANEQVLESTTATAGQQIAITGTAPEASAQVAPTFERQALTVSEFGTRSILESAAIKGGMSAGEALTSDTGAIVAKVGDVTQTLENAGVAQAAINQVEGAAADPAKLDEAVKNAELQAAVDQILTEQGIDTAKDEAAKVDGTTSNPGESKVLDKVEVKTDSGANASGLTLSNDGTGTVATANNQQQTTHNSGSGSQTESSWLTPYSGTYDMAPHLVATNLEARAEDYYIWIFKEQEQSSDMPQVSYSEFKDSVDRAKAMYEEVKVSTANDPNYTLPSLAEYLVTTSGLGTGDKGHYLFNDNEGVSAYLETGEYDHFADNFMSSSVYENNTPYHYYAISKSDSNTEYEGVVKPKMSKANIVVKWGTWTETSDGDGVFTPFDSTITYPSDTFSCPGDPTPGIMVNGEFNPLEYEPIITASGEMTWARLNCKSVSTIVSAAAGQPVKVKETAEGLYYMTGGLGQSLEEPVSVTETCNLKWSGTQTLTWQREPSWITGYTGVYDGNEHRAALVTAEQDSQYSIFIFNSDRGSYYENLVAAWTERREQNTSETLQQTLEYVSGTSIYASTSTKFGKYLYDSAEPEMVEDVEDGGLWYYFAVPKAGVSGDIMKGGFEVNVEFATAYIDWVTYVNGQYVTATPGAEFTVNPINPSAVPVSPQFYRFSGGLKEPIEGDMNARPHLSGPALNSSGLYEITLLGMAQYDKVGKFIGCVETYADNYLISEENRTFTYRLAGGSGGTGVTDPATEPQLDTTGVISGFAQGYPSASMGQDKISVSFQLAEATEAEIYGIFVGNPQGSGYLTSYDVLHGHQVWGNQVDGLVYCRTDSTGSASCEIPFDDWANATNDGYLAFIIKQGDVISYEPVFIDPEDTSGSWIDSTAPRIRSAYINSDGSKIYAEVSENVTVGADGTGFSIAGGSGTITSATVTSASIGSRTHYFIELGVSEYEAMTGSLSYEGDTVKDSSNNSLVATSVPIQDAAVEIASVTSSSDRSLVRVDLNGRLLDNTDYGTFTLKYGTDWDTATPIEGAYTEWVDECTWNETSSKQLGTVLFHIEDEIPPAVEGGKFFVQMNGVTKHLRNRAFEEMKVNQSPVPATGTMVAGQEPAPTATYDISDETLTLSFKAGSMLEVGGALVGGAVNCRFYIIDGDGNLFRLRGNYTDRGVHSLVFDNTGEYGMSGFGFDPDEVNWEGATLGYTSEIHNDDRYVGYFDELLAADGTIITELTDIPITVVQ